jgi:ABC-type transport system involved in cytochrome c biogenesis ATPase subunit
MQLQTGNANIMRCKRTQYSESFRQHLHVLGHSLFIKQGLQPLLNEHSSIFSSLLLRYYGSEIWISNLKQSQKLEASQMCF